jgi:hypothetical protein
VQALNLRMRIKELAFMKNKVLQFIRIYENNGISFYTHVEVRLNSQMVRAV